MCAESPASGARFVGQARFAQDLLIEKEPYHQLGKLLHELILLAIAKLDSKLANLSKIGRIFFYTYFADNAVSDY